MVSWVVLNIGYSCVYCVVYGGLGSTEHCVHNVCTVWCMVSWVVLNIGYSCVYCVVYGGLGSTEHCVQLCVLTIIGCIVNVLGTCCGDLVNGQISLYDL